MGDLSYSPLDYSPTPESFIFGKSASDLVSEYGSTIREIDPHIYSQAIRLAVNREKFYHWAGAEDMANVLERYDPAAADRLRKCHDKDAGRIEFCPSDPGHHARYIPESCDLRICPSCAERHSRRAMIRYEVRLNLLTSLGVRGWGLKGLTLTMRRDADSDDRDLYDLLVKKAKKLLRHFWLRDDKRAGAIMTVEWGPKGGNIHAHIILYGRYVDQSEIKDYWFKETEMTSVYITAYNGVSAALREGLKYATKPLGMSQGEILLTYEDLANIYLALKGRRRIHAFGSLFKGKFLKRLAAANGVDLDDDKPEMQTHCDVCGDALEREPIAIMRSFIAIAKGSEPLILKEGINFNISGLNLLGKPPPS